MSDPYTELVKRLEESVLKGPGTLSPQVRQAAAHFACEGPEIAQKYIEKVATKAYTVTDEEVQQLLQEGYSQDHLFELTVSVALGAGLLRLKRGLASLEEGEKHATEHP